MDSYDAAEPTGNYVNQDPDLHQPSSTMEEALKKMRTGPAGFVARIQLFMADYGLTMDQFAEMCKRDIPTFDVKNLNNWFSNRHQPQAELAGKVEVIMDKYASTHLKQMSLGDVINDAAGAVGMSKEEVKKNGIVIDREGNMVNLADGTTGVNIFDTVHHILHLDHMTKGKRISMILEIFSHIEHGDQD